MKVLILEDDHIHRNSIDAALKGDGHSTLALMDGRNLMLVLNQFQPEMIVLDDELAGQLASDLIHQIRMHGPNPRVPLVVVTAQFNEDAIVRNLDLGADDCLPKPINERVFTRRIRALARRCEPMPTARFVKKYDLVVDFDGHSISLRGTTLDLTLTEFKILREVAHENDRVVSRMDLQRRAFGSISVSARTLDVHVCALRKKIRPFGVTIESVRGVGYRLQPYAPERSHFQQEDRLTS